MCGVIGAFPKAGKFNGENLQNFYRLMRESNVRGMHAYGVACQSSFGHWEIGKFFNLRPAIEFVEQSPSCALIGHTRYDTSGDYKMPGNNQPIAFDKENIENFLVFNGVIRMTTKEQMEEEFHFKMKSANDGEIMLHLLGIGSKSNGEYNARSLLKDPAVSYAGIQVVNGKVSYMRNERRPLWKYESEDCLYIASTLDIFVRSFESLPIEHLAKEVEPDRIHYVES